jgi:hypothetical protein
MLISIDAIVTVVLVRRARGKDGHGSQIEGVVTRLRSVGNATRNAITLTYVLPIQTVIVVIRLGTLRLVIAI